MWLKLILTATLGGALLLQPIFAKEDSILIQSINNQQPLSVIKSLVTTQNLEARDTKGRSALMLATYKNDLPLVTLLTKLGADVNAQDDLLNSPFLYAGAAGHVAMAKIFLAHGARFDLYNRYRGSALIPAAERGHVEMVRLLSTTKDYPINHVNNLGWTALMEAVVLGDGGTNQQAIIKILLANGADSNISDKNGVSALDHARKRGFTEIVLLLATQ